MELIFTDINLIVQNNTNMILNMTLSFIIQPDFINKGSIYFNVICPERIFRNYGDY